MAAAANKPSALSSSSPLIANRQNPRPRNSEAGDPMRRSFGENPFPNNKPTVLANPRGFPNTSPTPANSPSDFPKKNSIGSEIVRRDFEDKENVKNQISNRARAPLNPKGSKNFMSPTISAASKVNPSPKKKVLSEKNEGNRGVIMEENIKQQPAKPSSVSFSDVISIIGGVDDKEEEPTPQMGFDDEKHPLMESHDMTVTDLDHKKAFALESNGEKNSVSFDQSFKISSPRHSVVYTSSSTVVAALDADPLIPPYDPKKNYLSPRPQFLHYRPNPRIENLNEGKRLEEIFTSESSSDTSEVSETEPLEENAASREFESAAEEEKAVVEEEEEEEEEEKMEERSSEQMLSENIKSNGVSKPHRLRPLKFLGGWLLVMGLMTVAYVAVSATFSPSSELSMLKDSGFYDFRVPPAFIEFVKANYEQLGEKVKMWSESSVAYIRMLMLSLGEEKEMGRQRFFHNLTDFVEDDCFDALFQPVAMAEPNHQGYKSVESNVEEDDEDQQKSEEEEPVKQEIGGENNFEGTPDIEDVDEEKPNRNESADTHKGLLEKEATGGAEDNFKAVFEEVSDQEDTTNYSRVFSGNESGAEETREFRQEIEAEIIKHQHCEGKPERIESASDNEDQQNTKANAGSDDIHGNDQQEETENDEMEVSEYQEETAGVDLPTEPSVVGHDLQPEFESTRKFDMDIEENRHGVSAEVSQVSQNALALSLTVLVLLAVSAVFFSKKAKPVLPNVASSASEQTPITKEQLNYSPMSVENLIKERLSSLSFQTQVDDTMQSCPSDTGSSFQKSGSLYSNRSLKELSEAQSQERKSVRKNSDNSNYRRESLASSASEYSIGSASYGSFTTYEKIPVRSGHHGEEEVITPVRRSSRLRNQVSVQ